MFMELARMGFGAGLKRVVLGDYWVLGVIGGGESLVWG